MFESFQCTESSFDPILGRAIKIAWIKVDKESHTNSGPKVTLKGQGQSSNFGPKAIAMTQNMRHHCKAWIPTARNTKPGWYAQHHKFVKYSQQGRDRDSFNWRFHNKWPIKI